MTRKTVFASLKLLNFSRVFFHAELLNFLTSTKILFCRFILNSYVFKGDKRLPYCIVVVVNQLTLAFSRNTIGYDQS